MEKIVSLLFVVSFLIGCAPKIGSQEWCDNLKEKPKGDWTAIETKDYAKNCIF